MITCGFESFTDPKTCAYQQAGDLLMALLEHPVLVSSSESFKAIPERKLSVSEHSGSEESTQSKCVYVFQREYATVDPALVDVSSHWYFLQLVVVNISWQEVSNFIGDDISQAF